VHAAAPIEGAKEPTGHGLQAEPLRKLPAAQADVPPKERPAAASVHDDEADDAPTARHRFAAPSSPNDEPAAGGYENVYEAAVVVSAAAGDASAGVHVGQGVAVAATVPAATLAGKAPQ